MTHERCTYSHLQIYNKHSNTNSAKQEVKKEKLMGSKESSEFEMSLHYSRYKGKEFHDMSECALDRLLAKYGLSIIGDLLQKRHFPSKNLQYYPNSGFEAALQKKNV